MEQVFKKYRDKHLTEEELNIITQKLIQAKFEAEQKEKWAKQLEALFQIMRKSDKS